MKNNEIVERLILLGNTLEQIAVKGRENVAALGACQSFVAQMIEDVQAPEPEGEEAP